MLTHQHFKDARLHTHVVQHNQQEILENIEKVIQKDKEMEARLKSTFLPSRKVAAVSAAVSSYMADSIKKTK
jgi:pyruvate carboxylase subunit A